MHWKVTSQSSETPKLNIFYSFLKTFSLQIGPRELLRLAHSELQEWQETAHTNSYIPHTTSKCSKCYFQCQVGSSLLIKHFLKPLARLEVANLSPSFVRFSRVNPQNLVEILLCISICSVSPEIHQLCERSSLSQPS